MASSRREYEMLFRLNAQLGSNYSAAFTKAQAQISKTQQQIGSLGKLQADITAYQKQQNAMAATERKLETLRQQYDNIQREINETEGHSSALENRLLSKKLAIEQTTAALNQHTQKAEQMGAALEKAGIDTKNLAGETERLSGEIQALQNEQQGVADGAEKMGNSGAAAITAYHETLVANGILDALKDIYDGMMECADASAVFESAVTGVYKTVDGTEVELLAISHEIRQLSTEIPATTDEIAGVAEAAGQLGIATGDVMEFTRVMIDLGESTNLTADEAASYLAKFANITKTSAQDYSRLGSVVVDLGNNFATTEADIVAMSTRLASGGRLAGLTEPEIMALAAAMSSVGIEAEAGGTAMTQTFNQIEKAVANNSDELVEYARIAGMSADDFAAAWEDRPMEAIQAFIAGLGRLDEQGESAVLVLDELGLSGIRQSNMLKSLGLASDTLAGAVQTANKAWDENIALSEEAAKRYATTESKQVMMRNAFNNLKIAIGYAYTPALRELYGIGTDVLKGMTEFVEENPRLVKAVTAAVGVVGVATAGITAYTAVTKLAKVATDLFAASIPGLKVFAAVTAGVAALTGAVVALTDAEDEETKAARALREELYAESQSVIDAHQEMADRFAQNRAAIEDNETETLALIQKLSDLADGTYQTADSQSAMQAIIDKLNSSIEGLNLSYSDVINNQDGVIQGIREMAQAEAERARQQAMFDEYVELIQKQKIEQQQLAEATDAAEAAQRSYTRAYADYMSTYNQWGEYGALGAWLDGTYEKYEDAQESLNEARKYQGELQDTLDKTNSRILEIESSWGYTAEASEDATMSWADASKTAFDAVQAEVEALIQEYNDAYDAALQSFEGQFDLFDRASMESEEYLNATVANAQAALDSQLAYWDSYAENIQTLQGVSATELGITQEAYDALMAYILDGSEEAAGLAKSLVSNITSGNTEAVAQLATTLGTVTARKEEIAATTTEWVTDFSLRMGELTGKMNQTVDSLELDDEAAAAAKSTIQAYADAILANQDIAVDAAAQVADAVAAAFGVTTQAQVQKITEDNILLWEPGSAEEAFDKTMGNLWLNGSQYSDYAGIFSGTEKLPGYASGTASAQRGYAWVGENGPELMFFRGGETVLSAAESTALMAAVPAEASYTTAGERSVTVSISIQVEGNADQRTVEALDAYSEEFAQRVRSVIAEAEYDAVRRGY